MARRSKKTYLGDGVYVEFDGFAMVLTTENGIAVTNRIVLDPEVYTALTRYVGGDADRPSLTNRRAINGAKAIDMMLRHSDLVELSAKVGSDDIIAKMGALILAAHRLTE